jgi:hypothetical protein
MSSISSVSSVTNPYQATNQGGPDAISQNFQALGSALQSGDISSAQSALSTFQQALQGASQTTASQPFGKNAQATTDYESLTSSLKSGNLTGAQKAFTSLQSDLKTTQSTLTAAKTVHKGHHHHHVAAAPASTTAVATSAATSTNGATTSSVVSGNNSLNTTA